MAREHDLPALALERVTHPVRRIFGTQPAHHREAGKGITGAKKGLSRLTRAELPAVPDHVRMHTRVARPRRQPVGLPLAQARECPLRIDQRPEGIGVVDEMDDHAFNARTMSFSSDAGVRREP